MNAMEFSLVTLACLLGGILAGMSMRVILPEHHLSEDAKDIVKLGTGMIATLGAIVLGLLISSAKGNFDMVSHQLREVGAKVILLDRILAQYGSETKDARELLRQSVSQAIRHSWPELAKEITSTGSDYADTLEYLQSKLRQLSPLNAAQSQLKSTAIQIIGDIDQSRWVIVEQRGMTSLPMAFLTIMVCWFALIFMSFGLLAPRNGTVIIVLLVCALSVACSLFLMLELDSPYGGMIKVSASPLLEALKHLGH